MPQQVGGAYEVRLVPDDDAGIGRDGDFTVSKKIERINRLVWRSARGKLHIQLDVLSRIIRHAPDFDLTGVIGLQDAVCQLLRRDPIRHIPDDEGLAVGFFNPGADAHLASASTIEKADSKTLIIRD